MKDCATPVAETRISLLGEGPYWSQRQQRLYYVDIKAPVLNWVDPKDNGTGSIDLTAPLCSLAEREDGRFICTGYAGYQYLYPDTGKVSFLTNPESKIPDNRFNDGAVDRAGRYWAGTISQTKAPVAGALYSLEPDGAAMRRADGLHGTNGLGWNPDNTLMYVVESWNYRVLVYDFDLMSGQLSNQRVFATIPASLGKPDGLTVDAEGCVWVAIWDGAVLLRFDAAGQVARTITLPVPRPTSLCFGGAGLDQLFITTARFGLSPSQIQSAPLSGTLLRVDVGTSGIPEVPVSLELYDGC